MTALVLRLNTSGQAMSWIHWQDAVLLYVKAQVVWTLGEQTMRFHGGYNRMNAARSYLDIHPIIATRGKVICDRTTTRLNNRELFQRDGHTCMYCLARPGERHLTRDHVIPLSRGGADCWTNVVTACRACNQRKADRFLEDTGMHLHAVPYTPNHAEWLILRNRHILTDQTAFLKTQCPKR